MSDGVSLSCSPTAPVSPMVDYEPPAFGGPPILPPITSPRRATRVPTPAADRSAGPDTRIAATFADAALRRVLEVIDRRRPLAQLRPLLASGLVESLLSAAARHGGAEPARLCRVRVRMAGTDGAAAEVSASYSRGARVHALAARIEQLPTPTGPRWQVVALHLG